MKQGKMPPMLLPQEIIRIKRDGGRLSQADIAAFIGGVADGHVSDAQIAAFAMTVLLRGMNRDERAALTLAMARSGRIIDWRGVDLPGPVLDKHSTGGVGDGISLVLAPAVAACGGFVPMVSGRGLGHTGGTLDKCESIPGYRAKPDLATLQRVVRKVGCAVVGATADIAPADRRMYAVRDVTASVESVDLITASILSKKLAAGLQGLVMDVKFGSGAFMPSLEQAEMLADSIVETATAAGLPTVALLTDMNEVLGGVAGNAVEVTAAIAVLKGEGGDGRYLAVARALAGEMLALGGLQPDPAAGAAAFDQALASGAAAERFAAMVAELGGPADLLERPRDYLPHAPIRRPVFAPTAGRVVRMDVRAVGLAVVDLGGGRADVADLIDPAVGLTDVVRLGDEVSPAGRPLAIIHARDEAGYGAAAERLRNACVVRDGDAVRGDLVAGRIAR
jgi:thymidine phosphorylase